MLRAEQNLETPPPPIYPAQFKKEDSKTEVRDLKKTPWTFWLLFSAFAASIGSFIFGFNLCVIDAPSIIFTHCSLDTSTEFYGFPECIDVHGLWNLIVTIFCIGGLAGALPSSLLSNWLGRKRSLIYNCILLIIGGLFMTFSINFSMLLFGRFIIGFAAGFLSCTVPTYLVEISPDSVRGQVASFHQSMLVLGIIFAQLLAFPLVSPGSQSWRLLFFFTSVLAILQLVLLILVPESPGYLANVGRLDQSEVVLKKLRNTNFVQDDLLRLTRETNSELAFSIIELLRYPPARKSVFIAVCSHIAQQLSGINAYFFYCVMIFGNINLPFSLKAVPLLLGIVNAVATAGAVIFIDRAGRKTLLLLSTLCCSIMTFSIIVGFLFDIGFVQVAATVLFVAGFAIGLGPVPWMISGDIFPPKAVSSGTSLAIAVNWVCNSIVAFSTEILCKTFGSFAFLPFLIVLLAYLAIVIFYLPETKGKEPGYL